MCTFNCFIVLVYVRCYSFSIIMATARPFVTSNFFYLGPLQSYWSAIPLSDGWSIIYKISTLIILTYVMNPIKLMFLPRGV